jgi:tetratricopeptide (TPR) repeat protein
VKYFDRSLEYFWGRIPRNRIFAALGLVLTVLYFITTLYLPFLARRRAPRKWDTEIVDISYKKCKALAMIDPKRFFVESFYFYKKIMTFDLGGFENGLGMFVGASALFSFTGISFGLSSKILNSVKDKVSKADLKNYSLYELTSTIHSYLKGYWQEIKEYEDELVKRNCRNGEIYEAVHHLYWHAQPCIAQGSFDIAEKIIGRLDDIFKAYQYDLSKTLRNDLKINLLGERRRLNDALTTSQEGIDFEGKTSLAFWMDLYSWRAFIYTLMENMEQADECLQHADRIRCQINAVPLELSGFWRAKSEYSLQQLRKSMEDGNRSKTIEYRKMALQSVKETLRIAKKVAHHRTETYKQVGIYYWLIGKQEKGLKWWQKAIVEAQRLGARPQLARIYFEVGKHLYETNRKYGMLDGIKADEYLDRARALFEEMNLQWDLDELSRLARV